MDYLTFIFLWETEKTPYLYSCENAVSGTAVSELDLEKERMRLTSLPRMNWTAGLHSLKSDIRPKTLPSISPLPRESAKCDLLC